MVPDWTGCLDLAGEAFERMVRPTTPTFSGNCQVRRSHASARLRLVVRAQLKRYLKSSARAVISGGGSPVPPCSVVSLRRV
jgi:hypothetical protein